MDNIRRQCKITVALRVMMQGMTIISNVKAQFLTYDLNCINILQQKVLLNTAMRLVML